MASSALTADQRKQFEELDALVTQAARLFLESRFNESGEIVRRVQGECETLAAGGDPQVLEALESIHGRLSKAHALLELEGIALPPLRKLGAAPSAPDSKPADPTQNLDQVARLAMSQRASHQQLIAQRKDLARKNWELGLPGQAMDQAESDHFFAIGNVGPAALQSTVEAAEALVPKVAELLGAPVDGPWVKGRITLVALAQRFDYTEYGKMVERRDLPQGSRGHWRYDVADAYGVLILPRSDEYSRDALLAQQIAGIYLAAQGHVPAWFAEGAARWVASRTAPADARVKAWEAEVPDALKSLTQPDDFLTGKISQQLADAAALSFVQMLASDNARFRRLMKSVRDGAEFETAFRGAYGGSPADVARVWAQQAARRTGAAGRAR